MTDAEIKLQAQMLTLMAEMSAVASKVEGMKAENTQRILTGSPLTYNEESFFNASHEFLNIADRLRKLT